jgi:DNA-binding transcriptional ArsR family regulator
LDDREETGRALGEAAKEAGGLDRRALRSRAKLFRALGHESRLMILWLLSDGEVCVCDLARATGLDQSTVSKHLSLLAGNGLVEGERRGHHVYYRVTAPWVVELLRSGEGTHQERE